MVNATTIIVGIIFILIIIIILVYFIYFNRVVQPSPIVTDFGFTLQSSTSLYITVASGTIPSTLSEPILVLETVPSGIPPNSAQGWSFYDQNGDVIDTISQSDNNKLVALFSNATQGFVNIGDIITWQNDPSSVPTLVTIPNALLVANGPIFSNATFYTLEVINTATSGSNIRLKVQSLPQINGQSQYIIPGPILTARPDTTTALNIEILITNVPILTIGVPTDQSSSQFTLKNIKSI